MEPTIPPGETTPQDLAEGAMRDSTLKFTIRAIEALPKTGKLCWFTDAAQSGLQICVTAAGSKRFYFYSRQNGKPVREALGRFPDVSIDDARNMVRERLVSVSRTSSATNNSDTFGQAFELWLNHVKPTKKTWKESERVFNRNLRPIHNTRLRKLTAARLETLRDTIGENNGKVIANRSLEIVAAVVNHLIKKGLFNGRNVAADVTRFPEKSRERFLSADEMRRFMEALKDERQLYQDFFKVLLFTGARKSNALEMEWKDVDLNSGVWMIPETKNGDSQPTALSPEVLKILVRRFEERNSRYPWVFPSARLPWKRLNDPRKAFARILKAAEISDFTMHDLRRTLGSWLAMSGVSETTIAKQLGHRPGSKATAIYARMSLASVRQAIGPVVAAMEHEGE